MPAEPRVAKYLFGSRTRERFLRLLGLLDQTYPSQAAELLGEQLVSVQRTANDLERDGVVASRQMGRTRVYELNKRYQHYRLLRELLMSMGQTDPQLVEAVSAIRQRPRRVGKAI